MALFLTTTAAQIDEELANRSLVLSVDESAHQTSEIQSRQRDTRLLTARQTRFIPDRIKWSLVGGTDWGHLLVC